MKFRNFMIIVMVLAMTAFTAFADDMKPGKGVTVTPARATWDTGFFTEVLARKGLEELGYKVKKVKDLAVPLFYQSLVLGDVDYWVNGWFPMHDAQLPKNFDKKAEKLGYVVKLSKLPTLQVWRKDWQSLKTADLYSSTHGLLTGQSTKCSPAKMLCG